MLTNLFLWRPKTPPASYFLKKATNIKSGSQTAGKETVAQITSKIEEIAKANKKI